MSLIENGEKRAMTDKHTAANILTLSRLLDVYGAGRTRWPAAERLRFAPLLATDAEADRLVREAAAFDRLLDLAPRLAPERERAVAQRIIAAAIANRRAPAQALPRVVQGRTPVWRAAALLAASLLVGVFAGFALTAGLDGETDLRPPVLDDGVSLLAEGELL